MWPNSGQLELSKSCSVLKWSGLPLTHVTMRRTKIAPHLRGGVSCHLSSHILYFYLFCREKKAKHFVLKCPIIVEKKEKTYIYTHHYSLLPYAQMFLHSFM